MQSETQQNITGTVFDIQRFSLHDGPGIRTTVFLKGCPLSCLWCHNPESHSRDTQVFYMPEKCIGCGYCFKTCPQGAHKMVETPEGPLHILARDLCKSCGFCARECYAKAIETVGRTATVDEVMEEVLADKPFYETSKGGITVSGGEPTMQAEFTLALLQKSKEEQISTVIETCLFCKWEKLEPLIPLTDIFYIDCKETDSELHKKYTGVDNALILENLRRLYAAEAKIRLRCPIIPGLNDRQEHFAAVAELYKEMPNMEGVEIMPYHRLGESKNERLGKNKEEESSAYEVPEKELVQSWKDQLTGFGAKVV